MKVAQQFIAGSDSKRWSVPLGTIEMTHFSLQMPLNRRTQTMVDRPWRDAALFKREPSTEVLGCSRIIPSHTPLSAPSERYTEAIARRAC
jgi:hypothetical protein